MRRGRSGTAVLLALACILLVGGPASAGEAELAVALARARARVIRGDHAGAREILDGLTGGAGAAETWSAVLHWRAALAARAGDLAAAERDLRRLKKLAAGDPVVRGDLGRVRLARGKLIWAVRDLAAAAEAAPDAAPLQYALGLALLASESFADARAALDRAAALDPEGFAERVRYHRGVAAYGAGDLPAARRDLSRLPGDDPHAEAAAAFLDAVYVEAGGRDRLGGDLLVGMQYDSNPILDPEGGTVGPGRDTTALLVDAGLHTAPLGPGRHQLLGSARVTITAYDDDEADDFDTFAFAGDAGYALAFDALGLAQALEARYRARVVLLGGGPLAERRDLYVFSESHGGRLGWRAALGEWGQTSLSYELRGAFYAHLGRDALGHHLALGQSVFLLGQQLRLYVRLLARVEDARAPGYDLWAVGPFVGVSARPFLDIDLLAWLSYQHEDHPDSVETWGARRTDDVVRFALGLTRDVAGLFRLTLSWEHSEHGSTLAQFDYRRDVFQLAMGVHY